MRKYVVLVVVVVILLLAACAPRSLRIGEGTAWGAGAFESNGERIYFTGTSERDGRISYSGGVGSGDMMIGGTLSCASCHGPSGRGGVHTMHMTVMDAADIRWSVLENETAEGHGDEDAQDTDNHPAYDFDTFRMAVVEGKHPDGKLLKASMPRWKMNDEDLRDLVEYLKSLP